MKGKEIMQAVATVTAVVILIVVSALIVGTVLGQSIFSSLTIINTTEISTAFGLFVTAVIGFFSLLGVMIALVWMISYIKPLFDKKEGIQSLAGN